MKAKIDITVKPKLGDKFKDTLDVDLPIEILEDKDELMEALIERKVIKGGGSISDSRTYVAYARHDSIFEKQIMRPRDIEIVLHFSIDKVHIDTDK